MRILKKIGEFAFDDGGSIKARVLRSGMWVGVGQISMQLLGFVRTVALSRLLAPEVFGFIAMAQIVVRAIETFTRPGVAQALIARQKEFEEASATAFTLLVMRGALLSVALALAAPFVANFYQAAELEAVLQVLGAVFVINGFISINTIGRQRELDFRGLTYMNQAAILIGTLITVVLAWYLRSVWALVLGQLLQVSASVILSYYFIGGRIQFAFNRDVAHELLKYGKFITGSSIAIFIVTELDSVVIGKLLGAEQLGFYALAISISSMTILSISQIVSSIMMPTYSKLQHDPVSLRNTYLRVLSLVMFLVVPVSAGLMCLTEPLISVVYGEKWLHAAVPLQVWALFGVPRVILIFNGYLFEGIGKPRIAFYLAVLRLAVIAPIVVPMVKAFGLLGASITVAIGAVVQCVVGLVILRRCVTIRLYDMVETIWRPLWTALVMSMIVVWMSSNLLHPRTPIGLSIAVLCGFAVYVLLNASFLLRLRNERFA